MSVTPSQEVTISASTTIADTASALIAVPRPKTTPAGPQETNTKDWVAENPFVRDDFQSGLALIKLGANFVAANVFLTRLAKVSSVSAAPQDPDSSTTMFPNGAAAAAAKVLYTHATGLATNSTEVTDLLSNLTIGADESFEVTLRNASGGGLTDVIRCHYEMGRNPADIVLRDQA